MGTQADISFDLLVDIQSYSDEEVKALRDRLVEEELAVSKRRRILHGQLDILRAEIVRRLRTKHQAGEGLFGDEDDTGEEGFAPTRLLRHPGPPPMQEQVFPPEASGD